jgi:hypothetical protein
MNSASRRRVELTRFDQADPTKVDTSVVKWDKTLLTSMLRQLWANRQGGIRMSFNVYTARMITALRLRFDHDGFHLRAKTELSKGTVMVWVTQKYRGNRPSRSR